MSQDGNNLFNQQDFQSSPFDASHGIYHTDMQMQFAPTVPHRQQPTTQQQQQHLGMNFTTSPFQNQDLMMPPPQFSYNYPGSPYERSESVIPCATNTGKQIQSKAERRAEHNAIERARRESLNSKFQQLAFALPNLQNDTRPSKSTIIDRTLDFVSGAVLKEERMNYRIKELEKFTRYLLSELDKKSASVTTIADDIHHSPLNIPAMIPSASSPPSSPPAMEESNHEDLVIHRSIRERKSPPVFKKEITNRRPVSRSSVAMIPKLEYKTTNWPISNQQQQQQQQQQQNIIQQQQLLLDHQMIKDNHSLNFQPQFRQNQAAMFQKFQDHSITEDNFMMNEQQQQQQQYDPNYMLNNSTAFMEHQHRR
ncbi:hypothetical protein BDF21DRAFT_427635 [Thamnidium elegans]|nr:hypothetical protein BDF21DRAFT_427635 [Thamnidium elegans]